MFITGASLVKNLPAMQEVQETQFPSLGYEDPLEKEILTHSIILTRKILWTEEPGRLQSLGLQRVRHDEWLNIHMHAHTHMFIILNHNIGLSENFSLSSEYVENFFLEVGEVAAKGWKLSAKCFRLEFKV